MRNQLSANSYQQSAVPYLSFPSKREVRFLTSSLSGCLSTYGWLTGQSRIKALDSPIKSGNDRKKLYRNDYNFTVSDNSEAGFTLVELMITMAIFLIVIASVSGVFTGLLTQFKQQSKISETNIEGIIGLDMLRRDIEHAGYGLPWVIPTGVTYSEAVNSTPCGTANPTTYNEATSQMPCGVPVINLTTQNPPRAIVTGNNLCSNGSDYLVIKAANIATNATAGKWTILGPGNVKRTWLNADGSQSNENVNKDNSGTTNNNVYLIVLSPGTTASNSRTLVADSASCTSRSFVGANAATQYGTTTNFAPADNTDVRIIYGLDPDTNPRMPFNRADYFVSTSNVPSQCATGTGILEKVVVNQNGGGLTNYLPLLDCVASMQVIYQLDMNDDGTIDTQSKGDGSLVTSSVGATVTTVQATLNSASLLRNRLKEVRVYVLAHEGQIDRTYTFNNFTAGACATCVRVGEVFGGQNLGRDVDLSAITNYLNYRWKTYTLIVKPNNLK